jgi:hypothetical protein
VRNLQVEMCWEGRRTLYVILNAWKRTGSTEGRDLARENMDLVKGYWGDDEDVKLNRV